MATYEISDGKSSFISWSGHLRPARDLQYDNGRVIAPFVVDVNNENDVDD
jgi:hypothetical protein